MSSRTVSLWPEDLIAPEIETPILILRQQAAALSEFTQNVLEGLVSTDVLSHMGRKHFALHKFVIRATALNGFDYPLFYARHDLLSLYPVEVFKPTMPNSFDPKPLFASASSEEFKADLKEFFASEEVRKVISSLLAQSQGTVETNGNGIEE